MPSCSRAKSPQGVEIVFTEEDHKYRSVVDGKEFTYISGTSFIGKFFKPFDPTGTITARCAKREGITPEQMKEKWAAKGRESCRLGTRTHETIEDVLNGHMPFRNTAESDDETKRFANAVAVATKLKDKLDIIGVEKIVFSPTLKIAGTVDLLAKSKQDDTYFIIDHKTNASIDTENKYGNFCLEPIAHVPDLNFWHYALLLNLYEYLLKASKYVSHDTKFKLMLNHVTSDKAKLILLPDMQSEIKDMVIWHLLNLQH